MGCHTLLQGIFSTQGSNLGLLQADSLSSELLGPHKIHDDCLSPPDPLVHLPRPFFPNQGISQLLGVETWIHLLGAPPFHPLQLARTEVSLEGWGHLLLAPLPPSFRSKGKKKVFATHRVGGGAPGPLGHVLLPDLQQLWPLRKVRPKEGQGRTTVQFRAQALIESENKDPAVLGPPGQPLCGLGLAQRLTMFICKGACFLGHVWQHKGLFCRPAAGQFRGAS